ncbi:MAG: hypothetical protein Q7T36_10635 [Fluviicoccus sp.]|uniref:hypothetical protein n=1 Tax=Fluviicoccus sp. TaxID=2003552 RepID=UPI002721CA00|nr:hypothetical protein [Fluviicoccus sp.]MDO8330911.1 hypothetical protein [Fluviicoccus sp.]
MNKRQQAWLGVALAAPVMAGLLWLGAGGEVRSAAGVRLQPAAEVVAVSPSPPVVSPSSVQAAAAKPAEAEPEIKTVSLNQDERRFILGEFVKAAEHDIAQAETGLAEAKLQGAGAEDIAGREEKLRAMRQMLQQTLQRNPGV